MSPSTFSLSLFAPFLRRSKKYKKLETDEPEKKKQEEAIDELTRINFKIVSTKYLVYFVPKLLDILENTFL